MRGDGLDGIGEESVQYRDRGQSSRAHINAGVGVEVLVSRDLEDGGSSLARGDDGRGEEVEPDLLQRIEVSLMQW